MRNVTHSVKGFTLVELLISTALLSLILFIASFSYSLFANNWNKEMGSYKKTAQFVRNIELVKRVLQSTNPLVITKKDMKKGLYFVGTNSSITAVSRYGLFNEFGVIYRISLEDAVDNSTDKSLVYREVAANNVLLVDESQAFQFSQKHVIMDRIKSIDIQFYGWDNINAKGLQLSGLGKAEKSWHKTYNAVSTGLFPEQARIKVRYMSANGVIETIIFNSVFSSNAEHGIDIPMI